MAVARAAPRPSVGSLGVRGLKAEPSSGSRGGTFSRVYRMPGRGASYVQTCYQQATEAGMLEVMSDPLKLRERRARGTA